MKKRQYSPGDYREDYLLNNSEYEPGFPGIRVHSFCHSRIYPRWRPIDISRPYIMLSMIISGGENFLNADGDRILREPDSFSIHDLNNTRSGKVYLHKETLERYFVLLEVNRFLRDLLQSMFPASLPQFRSPHPERLKRGFEDIRRVLRKKGETDNALLGAMAFRLLCEAAGQLAPPNRLPAPLTAALRHIENRFTFPELTRRETAAVSGVSTVVLGKLFRTHLQTTVNHYVVRLRMEKAKKLLAQTRLPVAEIAAMCGFAQSCYFSKVFRRQTGSLPRAYRSRKDQAEL